MPTVAQLKAQLAAKGLPTDGVKAVLEARLAAAVPAAAAPAHGVRPRAARGRAAFRARRWLRGASRAAKAIP